MIFIGYGICWGPASQRFRCGGMYDQDQVTRLEWEISVRMYTVHERVAAKTVNSCEEVYGPRPGIPSRAVIPCQVVYLPDRTIRRGSCVFAYHKKLW